MELVELAKAVTFSIESQIILGRQCCQWWKDYYILRSRGLKYFLFKRRLFSISDIILFSQLSTSCIFFHYLFMFGLIFYRQTIGKHSVHKRYNIKTAGQSSNQGLFVNILPLRTDTTYFETLVFASFFIGHSTSNYMTFHMRITIQ